nr:ORF45 Ld-lef11 [Lymantria dispar multiple nucleopolyhedrovirus]
MAPAVVGASQLRGGDSPGPARNRDHCLNRSEVYALTREAINKRKHLGDVKGVCAHLFDDSFSAQSDYISRFASSKRKRSPTASRCRRCTARTRKRSSAARRTITTISTSCSTAGTIATRSAATTL